MQDKIFRGKIYECTCSFMLFATKSFKAIAVEEMEPIFVKVKVSELKKYLQVRGISVANNVAKNFGICL